VYAHPGGGVVQHGPFALACYWTVARERGLHLSNLSGTGQSDFFLTYLGCITKQQVPPAVGLRLNADIVEFCEEHLPHWVPVSIAGYNGADSGLNAPQELGAVFATSIEYLDEAARRGTVPLEALAHRVGGINLRVGLDLFEDVAKLRAARRMWTRLLTDRYGITDPRASRLRIHSLTAGSAMTYQQPLNNIVRGTVMALAGVLGGTQSLGVSGYDEAISIPSEHAHQMSIRIQQILQNECNITGVADPLGGSHYIEALTDELEERAFAFIGEIEEKGGFIASLDSGWLHAVASENQVAELHAVESGDKRVVGVNLATEDESPFTVDGFRGSSDAWDRGMERLRELKRNRDGRGAVDALRSLDAACRSGRNVMPAMMDAVAARVTVGEVGDVFRSAFGDWDVPIRF
ncbi:MAG TPA: acyl-CoA mutase large subunit family protein, partial [Acidimicrobiales bacterium]|nr:acyl-CoA mutase large subunit family protein [Acidimicrobiales bacterium]